MSDVAVACQKNGNPAIAYINHSNDNDLEIKNLALDQGYEPPMLVLKSTHSLDVKQLSEFFINQAVNFHDDRLSPVELLLNQLYAAEFVGSDWDYLNFSDEGNAISFYSEEVTFRVLKSDIKKEHCHRDGESSSRWTLVDEAGEQYTVYIDCYTLSPIKSHLLNLIE